jgi:hypothetical protein
VLLAADEADGFWRVGICLLGKSGGVYKARCGGKRKVRNFVRKRDRDSRAVFGTGLKSVYKKKLIFFKFFNYIDVKNSFFLK